MAEPHTQPNEPTPSDTAPRAKAKTPKRVIFFGACAVIAIVVYCIVNLDTISALCTRLGGILSPLVIGGVIAYLCNPFLKFYEFVVFRRMKKNGLRRGLSLLFTVLTAIGILAAVIALVLPELVSSISQLVTNFDSYLDGLLSAVQGIINKVTVNLPEEYRDIIDVSDKEKLYAFIEQLFGSMENALSKLLSTLQSYVLDERFLGNLWAFVTGFISTLFDVIIGIFIAFYILTSKEKRIAQIRKFRAAYFSERQDAKLTELTRLVDRTFGGFVKGVLLDALAVGVVTFILLSIFRVSEYNLLIAAICAITNIIPVFGPFIGAIPSGLIVLISNPSKLLVFIILVVVIQQIDGNILCPRIQGNNTGISSLAVLVAITVMGSLGGILGMVIGVPIFAVIIELVKRAIEERLERRGVPTDTTYYYPANAVGNAEEEVYYEHSHLRYLYDHSKIKPYIDRMTAAVRRKKARKVETAKPADAAEVAETTETAEATSASDEQD